MLHLRLLGNGADHRGLWTVDTFKQTFEALNPLPDTPMDLETDFRAETVVFSARSADISKIATTFCQHVHTFILQGLQGYEAEVVTFLNGEDREHEFSVVVDYGERSTYQIIVAAPVAARNIVANFEFIFEQMETSSSWDVNSIESYASIPNGVQFVARETDTIKLISDLANAIKYILLTPDHVDILVQESRRGNVIRLRVGLVREEGIVWGSAPPRMPSVQSPSLMIKDPKDICAVCLDPLTKMLAQPSCAHTFHIKCLRKLWHRSTRAFLCPMCRAPMNHLQSVMILQESRCPKTRSQKLSIADRVKKRRLNQRI